MSSSSSPAWFSLTFADATAPLEPLPVRDDELPFAVELLLAPTATPAECATAASTTNVASVGGDDTATTDAAADAAASAAASAADESAPPMPNGDAASSTEAAALRRGALAVCGVRFAAKHRASGARVDVHLAAAQRALVIKFHNEQEADLTVDVLDDACSIDIDEQDRLVAITLRNCTQLPVALSTYLTEHTWMRVPLVLDYQPLNTVDLCRFVVEQNQQQHHHHQHQQQESIDNTSSERRISSKSSKVAGKNGASSANCAQRAAADLPPALRTVIESRSALGESHLRHLPPALRYRHAVVRHLAWLALPSSLVREAERVLAPLPAASVRARLLPFEADELASLLERQTAALEALDRDPTPLLAWLRDALRVRSLRAVGTYFTQLVSYVLEHIAGMHEVHTKLQVFGHQKTLGDVDVVFRYPPAAAEAATEAAASATREPSSDAAPRGEPLQAFEMAIKNYVRVDGDALRDARCERDDPLLPLSMYCGPLSTGDSLWNILVRTKKRTDALVAAPEFGVTLRAAFGVSSEAPPDLHTRLLLRGNLFERFEQLPACSRGYFSLRWRSTDDSVAQLSAVLAPDDAGRSRFAMLNKFDISLVAIVADDAAALEPFLPVEQFCAKYAKELDDDVRATSMVEIRLTDDNTLWLERRRWWLIPENWRPTKQSKQTN